MEGRYYVFKIVLNSQGTETRDLTPYDDINTAERKYHEAFNVIGGGPTFISCCVMDRYMNQLPGYNGYWKLEETPEA